MEWKIIDHNLPDSLMWVWVPEFKERALAVAVDHVIIDIETGEEIHASHYIVIVEPDTGPTVH